ncbi:hypothetical protein Tco_1087946, partial [Tanacetum coccineum]
MELVQEATPICEGSYRLTSLERQEMWNDCRSCKVRVVRMVTCGGKHLVHGDDVAKTVFRMRNGHVEVYGYAFWVNQCTNGFHGVNEPSVHGSKYGSDLVAVIMCLYVMWYASWLCVQLESFMWRFE